MFWSFNVYFLIKTLLKLCRNIYTFVADDRIFCIFTVFKNHSRYFLAIDTFIYCRFWYENPSVFKPEQLSQLKQSSLAKVVCDNSDDIQRVPKDVFAMEEDGSKHFVECKTIPAISLHVWFGKLIHQLSFDFNGKIKNKICMYFAFWLFYTLSLNL